MESYGSEFRRRYSRGSAVFFAAGISFLVFACIFGFSNPAAALCLAILCVIFLISGVFSYRGIFAKERENGADEHAGIEDAADIPEVSPEIKTKRRKGGVAFAFGIFLILSSPLWYVKDFEVILPVVIMAGAVLMAYGLFLMASRSEKK